MGQLFAHHTMSVSCEDCLSAGELTLDFRFLHAMHAEGCCVRLRFPKALLELTPSSRSWVGFGRRVRRGSVILYLYTDVQDQF